MLAAATVRCTLTQTLSMLRTAAVEPYAFGATESAARFVVAGKHGDDPAPIAEYRRDAVRCVPAGKNIQRASCERLHGHLRILTS
jgi:hypothetical protein